MVLIDVSSLSDSFFTQRYVDVDAKILIHLLPQAHGALYS